MSYDTKIMTCRSGIAQKSLIQEDSAIGRENARLPLLEIAVQIRTNGELAPEPLHEQGKVPTKRFKHCPKTSQFARLPRDELSTCY